MSCDQLRMVTVKVLCIHQGPQRSYASVEAIVDGLRSTRNAHLWQN